MQDGTELLGSDTTSPSPYILQFSCPDPTTGSQAAPPFPAPPTPTNVYMTTTVYTDVPARTTTTLVTYASQSYGTVEVELPGIYSTSTVYYGGADTVTSTVTSYTGAAAGTVIVSAPATQIPTAIASDQSSGVAATTSQTTLSPLPSGDPNPNQDVVTPPPSCNNNGLQWAEYDNTGGSYAPNYPTFDPTTYKTAHVNYQGETNTVGGAEFTYNGNNNDGNVTLYDGTVINNANFVLNHQGYIYAPQTGTYTFSSYDADVS